MKSMNTLLALALLVLPMMAGAQTFSRVTSVSDLRTDIDYLLVSEVDGMAVTAASADKKALDMTKVSITNHTLQSDGTLACVRLAKSGGYWFVKLTSDGKRIGKSTSADTSLAFAGGESSEKNYQWRITTDTIWHPHTGRYLAYNGNSKSPQAKAYTAQGYGAVVLYQNVQQTGINRVDAEADTSVQNAYVYSLSGQKIMKREDWSNGKMSLPKGVYIIDGKKRLLK